MGLDNLIGLDSKPKQRRPEPIDIDTEDEKRKRRAALFGTKGGAAGQKVLDSNVGGRNTLLGN